MVAGGGHRLLYARCGCLSLVDLSSGIRSAASTWSACRVVEHFEPGQCKDCQLCCRLHGSDDRHVRFHPVGIVNQISDMPTPLTYLQSYVHEDSAPDNRRVLHGTCTLNPGLMKAKTPSHEVTNRLRLTAYGNSAVHYTSLGKRAVSSWVVARDGKKQTETQGSQKETSSSLSTGGLSMCYVLQMARYKIRLDVRLGWFFATHVGGAPGLVAFHILRVSLRGAVRRAVETGADHFVALGLVARGIYTCEFGGIVDRSESVRAVDGVAVKRV